MRRALRPGVGADPSPARVSAQRPGPRHRRPLRTQFGAPGGFSALVSLIEDYGEAIEYDLARELGWDLLDFFRARRPWPQLLRLIERLPDHSHYKSAIHNDDELALAQREAERREGKRSGRPSPKVDLRVWTPERAALTDVADILLGIRSSLEAQRTGKRQKTPTMPRPVLAVDRIEQNEVLRRHRDRVALMLPKRR